MAIKHIFAILAVVAIVFPPFALAAEYIVGDDSGWTSNFDYQAWAKDKEFRVGDKLVFKYPVGAHNVFKVNGTGFSDCLKPPVNEALVTGNDVILLATPGRKWYICGVAQHCAVGGQKLFITVLPSGDQMLAPSPLPSAEAPTSAATDLASSRGQAFVAAIFAIIIMAVGY